MRRVFRQSQRAALLGVAIALAAGCGEGVNEPIEDGAPPGLGGRNLLVFASDRGRAPGLTDIYLYDVDAPGLIPLGGLNSATAAERHPALTRDANRLYFDAAGDLQAYDVLLRQRVAFPGVNTAAPESEPAPAADGLHIAFVRRAGAFRRIHMVHGWPPDSVVSLAGLDTSAAWNDFSPVCDSTARRVAFTTDRAGQLDVLVWDRDSAGVLTLPDLASPDSDVEPSITPSGRFVAFSSNRPGASGSYRIYLYDLESRAFVTLPGIAVDGDDRQPSVSADAERIAFESNRSFGTARQDVWIYERALGRARSTSSIASPADDLEPWLLPR